VRSPSISERRERLEEFSAVASPATLGARGRRETARELAEHRFVVFDADTIGRGQHGDRAR
jgi:hypothetical protein